MACHHRPKAPVILKARRSCLYGPEGMARAWVHAQLQRQGQHDRLGE